MSILSHVPKKNLDMSILSHVPKKNLDMSILSHVPQEDVRLVNLFTHLEKFRHAYLLLNKKSHVPKR